MSQDIINYKRDSKTGALINQDRSGYRNARSRKKHVLMQKQEAAAKNKEIANLRSRLERLEALILKDDV